MHRNIRLLGEMLLILITVELGIMLVLPSIAAQLAPWVEAVLDATLLAFISSPLIYWRSAVHLNRAALSPQAHSAAANISRNRAIALALGVQLLGLSLTGAMLAWKVGDNDKERLAANQWRAERLHLEIERRFNQTQYGLRGLRATYLSQANLDYAAFRTWVAARNLSTEFPGIRGLGFVDPVQRSGLEHYVQSVRKRDHPDFRVRTQGDAPDLFVIRHIEPLAKNRAALGFDIGSEPRRRQAVERAIASREPTLSAHIELVQDAQQTPGFLYLLPVYKNPPEGEPGSRRADTLQGLVYAPIVVKELLEGTAAVADHMLDFAIYDTFHQEESLVYGRPPPGLGHDSAAHKELLSQTLDIGGRQFHVDFWPSEKAAALEGQDPTLVFLALSGALASMLLAGGTWMLSLSRLRATRLAQAMTRDMERLARVASHTKNAVAVLSAQGGIEWFNTSFSSVSGLVEGTALDVPLAGLSCLHQHNAQALEQLRHSMAQAQHCQVELQFTPRSGSARLLAMELTPVRAESGELSSFIVVGTDITDIKRVQRSLEEAIRSSEALLQTVELHAIVSFTDLQGCITHANNMFCAVSGYSREELMGRKHNIVNSGAHPAAFWNDIWATIASGQSWRGEICNRRKDGSLYWVDSMIAPFIGTDGLVEKYVSIRTDITQRKANEAALALATQRLELAIEGGNEGLWDWMDIHADAQWWSPSYYKLLGYSPEELPASARNYVSLLHPDSVEPSRLATKAALTGAAEFSIEVQLRTASGAYRWFSTRAKVYRDSTGAPQRMAGASRDVTEQRQAQEQLRQAMAEAQAATVAKGQFLANMSHELRTPMNAVLGMLTLLDNTELSEQQEDYVHKSRSAAQALLAILNDILDLSKVEAGKMELDPQPTQLELLMQDLSVVLSAYVGKKPVEILFDIDAALPQAVVVDANRLRQVLINLAGNAVKFTEQGEVVVRLALESHSASHARIAFAVSDTGIGISPEQQRKLFHAFSQAEASTTRRFGGTGLGLAISQQLVQLMGGDIAVDSVPGLGSTFHFVLELPTVVADPGSAQPGATQALRVLLVEDNRVARELTHAMCEANGWDCTAVASGEAALALFGSSATPAPVFDAVLMDWNLPGMDGWHTVAQLRTCMPQPPNGQQTIVMVSAVARKNLNELSAQDQQLVDGYLVKPVTAHMLRNAVLNRPDGMHRIRLKSRASASRPLSGLHILVVEDNLINQQVAEELLNAKGARVSLAANGQLGVQAIAAAQPQFDLVLMDLQMPVMDGYAATAYVREQLHLHALPIVAMTANAMATDRDECLAAGMNEHVGKPFDLNRLTGLILRLTGRSQGSPSPDPAPASGTESGLDVATALERMGGQSALFLRSARDFLDQLPQHMPPLRRHVADDDLAAARMLLHTLKGTAALVGCFALSREAARLEKLAQASNLEALRTALPELETLLHSTAPALAAALQTMAGTDAPTPPPPADPALLAALAQLEPLLRAEDFSALECHAAQRDTLDRLPAPARDALNDALQSLDLTRALGVVESALRALGPPQASSGS